MASSKFNTLPDFEVRIARSDEDIKAAQRLRYRVFVEEMGANGPMIDHTAQLEKDAFDAHAMQRALWGDADNDCAAGSSKARSGSSQW